MPRVCDRRRHPRTPLACPAALRDKSGRLLFHGRAADVSPGGIRVIGSGGAELHEGQMVWVELSVPTLRDSGSRHRIVKMRGEVRRICLMGDWRSVLVVIFETDFSQNLLDPAL